MEHARPHPSLDISLKEGFESSSSSLDSDSKSFDYINKVSGPSVNGNGKGMHRKTVELETELPGMEEKVKVTKQENVDASLRQEISRLKSELSTRESEVLLMGNLQAQLNAAQCDIKLRDASVGKEKKKVLELQKRVDELESQVYDFDCKFGTLEEELKMTKEKFGGSVEEIRNPKVLNDELVNKTYEGAHQSQVQLELIHDLKVALHDLQENFYLENEKLRFDVSSLLGEQAVLNAKIGEWEIQNRSLENEVKQCKVEKLEMKVLHEAKEIRWQADIEQLKAELKRKGEAVEALNKTNDMLKLKYDMLMADKDGVNAKVDTLNAELSHRDNQILQMEAHRCQLQLEHVVPMAGSESAWKLRNEERLRVEELEKEVEKQRAVISDRAEEKREAIRQLCFSLEHYKSGYKEVRQAYIVLKRHNVLAL